VGWQLKLPCRRCATPSNGTIEPNRFDCDARKHSFDAIMQKLGLEFDRI